MAISFVFIICCYFYSLCLKIKIWDHIKVVYDDDLSLSLMINEVLVESFLYRFSLEGILTLIQTRSGVSIIRIPVLRKTSSLLKN